MKYILAVVLLSLQVSVVAKESCAGIKGVVDAEACMLKQSVEEMDCDLDKQFQQVVGMYKKINATDTVKRLEDAQHAWIQYRDKVCDFESHAFGEVNEILRARCIARITDNRLDELNEFGDE